MEPNVELAEKDLAEIASRAGSTESLPQHSDSSRFDEKNGAHITPDSRTSRDSSTNTPKKPHSSDKDSENDPLSHLPPHEQEIIRRQIDSPQIKVSPRMLFRYATRYDIIIMVVSSICAIAAGAALPLMTIIFGQLTGTFQSFFQGNLAESDFNHELSHFTLYYIYLAIAEFATVYIATVGWSYTGEHITRKIREQYLAAVLRQNVGFYDRIGSGEITTRITTDTNLVQDGISEKVSLSMTAFATFITAFVIGFVKDYILTFILCSTLVSIVGTFGIGSRFMVAWNKTSLSHAASGGTVVEEVLSSIRNATAFGTQNKLAVQYDSHLKESERFGVRHKGILGIMFGVMMMIINLTYALAFWQGSRFLVAGTNGITLPDILTIILAIMMGSFSLANVGPNIQAFTTGMAAAGKIYSTIDRKSPLDPTDGKGKIVDEVEGTVELRNIRHIYPSRPEVVVMEDVSLVVPASKTTALVGSSGSGKSTIVGLVERFYDPVGGQVFLDGIDLRDLNLQSLRQHISLVSQEPTLFSATIFNNIAHGLIGTQFENCEHEKKRQLIEDAAKMSNAHDFIKNLPEGYETNVGERGFLLSGGQKQRIAIARAVVSDPKILLLDEATSALDTKSEGVVQAALDKAAQGRTTIVIAHRLSTIRDADNIVVMTQGRIVEQGTHNHLLEREGAYYNLVEAQKIATANEQEQAKVDAAESDEEEHEVLDVSEKNLDRVKTNVSSKSSPSMRSRGSQMFRTTTTKSASAQVLNDMEAQINPRQKQYSLWTLIKTVTKFNKEEWPIMTLGLLFSVLAGGGNPTSSVFFAKSIVALSQPPNMYGLLRHDIDFWCWMYFMLAFEQLISWAGQGLIFAYASEKLIRRTRDRSFRTMLRQDISFFDRDENSGGALTTFLSTETTNLAGLSGQTLGTILSTSATLIGGFSLSLAIGWKLGLVCIATVPVVLGCGFLRFWLLTRLQDRAKRAYEKSAGYACEATSAIRTVASLTREQDVWDEYHRQVEAQNAASLISVIKSASLYAASQSLMFLCIALGFWYGGTLIGSHEYSETQFFICFTSVIFGAQSAGTIFSFAPDMGKAKHAAQELKTLFDRQPLIDSWSPEGEKLSDIEGRLEFDDVHFRYINRPEVPVLRGLNLSVNPGQYIALVGPSGCGKSTTISLLERFYDPLSGTVSLDGKPINSLNINSYRSKLALVSQEPTLYQGTIRDNILLGLGDSIDMSTPLDSANQIEAPLPDDIDDRIKRACDDANISTFLASLPEGINTVVGNKGVMLSGGQKQRIAIARALIRDPKILLLDEATSALDSESEKIVQEALDRAAKGRTTIAVAHRLSTIQKSDIIYVFEGGRIVEQGTHRELMGRKGRYYEMVSLQSLDRTG